MTDTPTEQKRPQAYVKHGDRMRQNRLRTRGLAAIDGRSYEGKIALNWQASAIKVKGGSACPHWLKVEIRLACFDLWRLLHLQSYVIADANQRGTIINRRRRELSKVHDQLSEIDARFMRRVEALQLDKRTGGSVPDLAQLLAQRQEAGK